MHKAAILQELQSTQEFFNRSTRNLTEEVANFAPVEGTMTAAQQVAHVAQTIEWFFEGAFRPEAFSSDWEAAAKETAAVTSLAAAREWLDRAFATARAKTEAASQEDWNAPLAPNPFFGEIPRFVIIGAITDHTAHHRGALTVYARLNNITPPMPYMDM
ncbi:MAG: DinB family protein [Bryobacteraceae bacterium]|nr:DinB family protein [Solibacteraceae bacterium]MCO5353070.1 DinB family protein [Bryobacteraceae bacterium]